MTTPHPTQVRIMLMWNWERFPEDDEGFMARQPYRLGRHTNDDREFAMMDKLYRNTPKMHYSTEGLGKRRASRNCQRASGMRHNGWKTRKWYDEPETSVKAWLENQ